MTFNLFLRIRSQGTSRHGSCESCANDQFQGIDELGITHQGVRQLLIKLHAQGRVSFGDPENPFWIVMRAGDQTPFLSRDEERVLSAVPSEYATDVTKIRLATRISENKVRQALEHLIIGRFVETFEGLQGDRIYRITVAV